MVKKKKEEGSEVVIMNTVNLDIQVMDVMIRGRSPLIMSKFSEETKKDILSKQQGVKVIKKKVRDIKKEVEDATHKTQSGKVGFPFYGFKKGMIETTSFIGDKKFSKKLVSAIQILNVEDGLIPIEFKKRGQIEHFVNPNTLFSPIFYEWSCKLQIAFDSNNVSAGDVINLLNYAGYYVGLGCWRPKGKDGGSGVYGMYNCTAI